MTDFLILYNSNELFRFSSNSLIYISSDGNYSDIYTIDGEKKTLTIQLGNIEDAINKQLHSQEYEFVRIGRSLIINLHFLYCINPSKQQLILSDSHTFKYCLEASKEALKHLKEYYEREAKK